MSNIQQLTVLTVIFSPGLVTGLGIGGIPFLLDPLKKEVSHMRLSLRDFKSTVLRRQTELEAEILTGIRTRSETFIFEVSCYLGRTALGPGYPVRLVLANWSS